jgi:hypothetical protein
LLEAELNESHAPALTLRFAVDSFLKLFNLNTIVVAGGFLNTYPLACFGD